MKSLLPTVETGKGARKRFGQHFLVDPAVLDEIVACLDSPETGPLVEIGPGRGALTERLLARGFTLNAVEIDRDLIAHLGHRFSKASGLTLHEGDALHFDFTALSPPAQALRLVGNLPYNISTPLLFRLLELGSRVREMCFMLQKEVAARMVAVPGTADYGRLAVMTQAFCDVGVAFDVPPEAFAPPPRVDSSVVLLRPHTRRTCRFSDLSTLVAEAFLHRRKMLRQTLARRFPAGTLESLGIAATDRPENISVDQYVALAGLVTAP